MVYIVPISNATLAPGCNVGLTDPDSESIVELVALSSKLTEIDSNPLTPTSLSLSNTGLSVELWQLIHRFQQIKY